MAIKYFVNEEKRQVIGLLENTRYDAVNKIEKMLGDTEFCICGIKKYLMPSEYRAVVQCDPRDEFSVEEGKKKAKERIMKRYYPALDKRVNKFLDAVRAFNRKIFEDHSVEENTP